MDLSGPGFTGRWQDGTGADLDLYRGSTNPSLGYYFPSFRTGDPRYTLVATNQGKDLNAISVFNLANGRSVDTDLQVGSSSMTVTLDPAGLATPITLTTNFGPYFRGPISLSASG
jgi:hypothetical protein